MLLAGGSFRLLQGRGVAAGLGPAAGDQGAVQVGTPSLAARHGWFGWAGMIDLAGDALIPDQSCQLQGGAIRDAGAGGGQPIQPDHMAGNAQGLPVHDRHVVGGERAGQSGRRGE